MKIVKIIIIALLAVFTFGLANAQVRVRASIGARPQQRVIVQHRPYHRRVVVVRHRYHRRPVYRRHH